MLVPCEVTHSAPHLSQGLYQMLEVKWGTRKTWSLSLCSLTFIGEGRQIIIIK